MTHKSIPAEQRHAAGVADSLIRLSVGLEEPEDLMADLARAFAVLKEAGAESIIVQTTAAAC